MYVYSSYKYTIIPAAAAAAATDLHFLPIVRLTYPTSAPSYHEKKRGFEYYDGRVKTFIFGSFPEEIEALFVSYSSLLDQ